MKSFMQTHLRDSNDFAYDSFDKHNITMQQILQGLMQDI